MGWRACARHTPEPIPALRMDVLAKRNILAVCNMLADSSGRSLMCHVQG